MDARQRVFAAATQLANEGVKPTVALVRDAAKCSSADATKFLREWKQERAQEAAAAADVPSVPGAVQQLAERTTTALWAAAVQAARTEFDAERAELLQNAEDARAEADELATELDKAAAELVAGKEALEHQEFLAEGDRMTERNKLDTMTSERDAAIRSRDEAVAERDRAREEKAVAEAARAQAEGIVAGLREALATLAPPTEK